MTLPPDLVDFFCSPTPCAKHVISPGFAIVMITTLIYGESSKKRRKIWNRGRVLKENKNFDAKTYTIRTKQTAPERKHLFASTYKGRADYCPPRVGHT